MTTVYKFPILNGYGRVTGYYDYTVLERINFFRKAIKKAIKENSEGTPNIEYIKDLLRDYKKAKKVYFKEIKNV